MHDVRHSFGQPGIDEGVDERRKDVHEGGEALYSKELDLIAQVRHGLSGHNFNQNVHELLCREALHLVLLSVGQAVSELHGALVHEHLIIAFEHA